jgi:hypothetical protein
MVKMLEREPKRYSAYFRGWCQAFGEHESIPGEENDIHWLFTEHQAGFILPKPIIRRLYREVLLHRQPPPLTFGHDAVEIGSLQFALASRQEKRILDIIESILTSGDDHHVYLTSHLMYGTEARIITLSTKKPLTIIYKEIGTLRIQLLH